MPRHDEKGSPYSEKASIRSKGPQWSKEVPQEEKRGSPFRLLLDPPPPHTARRTGLGLSCSFICIIPQHKCLQDDALQDDMHILRDYLVLVVK